MVQAASVRLHDFVEHEQQRILRCAVVKMKQLSPDRDEAELSAALAPLLDDIKRALQRAAGEPVTSPLPGHSEAAAGVGELPGFEGASVGEIVRAIGMISDAIGEIGTQQRRAFDAHDYQMFNRCMDTSMAAAIDRHESAARSRRDLENTARLGALAHELRNALGSATMAFAILRGGKSGISSPVGDVLARSLTRMDTLVANTLAAVRLDIGRQDSTDIAVARLLQDLVAEAVVERGITIAVDVRGEPHVRCDEALLASAIANLLQNALKFTRADGRIELRASETESGTRIEVEDECGGLPAGVETSMFAPFRQNLPDRRGLGLGLAITREAIAACHGDIAVHDLPGKGCVFVIDLPRLERA